MKRKASSLTTCIASATTLLLATTVFAAGIAPQPAICDRACWNAWSPTGGISQISSLTRGVIHHTAGAADYNVNNIEESKSRVRAIQNSPMDGNGWSDIGYHTLTDKLGNNFEGREGSLVSLPRGAHDGINANSFGFNIMGYYHTPYNNTPTYEGRMSLYDFIAWRIPDPFTGLGGSTYGGTPNVGYVCGHRDASATACPGDLMYAYIGTDNNGGEARLQINDRILNGGGGPTPTPTPSPTPPDPGTDVIVDNDDGPPYYAETGAWTTSGSTGYNGGTYRFATVGGAHTANWTASLSEAGTYEVSVFYRAGTNRATSTKYTVGGQDFYIDQTQNDMVWTLLGTVTLAAGDNTTTLDSAGSSGNSVVISDAVHFLKVGGGTPTPTPTPSPTPSPTPTASSVHVDSITLSTLNAGKGRKNGQADVVIKNDVGGLVSGAQVTGIFTGDYDETVVATTDGNGVATLVTTQTAKGGINFTLCVDNVVDALPYNSGDNVVTCANY
jgi:hypothetical protein